LARRPLSTETLALRLRYARKCRRYQVGWLAMHLDVVPSAIEGWERGSRPVRHEMLRQLAYYLDVPILWLVTGDGEPPCRPMTDGEIMMARADISPKERLHRLRQRRPTLAQMPDL
jgi:transcriptional regulator with XRE-family HTH domain